MDFQKLGNELQFKAVRSSGKGGQNVNKVSTKVELRFDVIASAVLTEEVKELVLANLSNRISNEGILRLVSQETRSQSSNKDRIIKRFHKMIHDASQVPLARKPTRTPKSVKRKFLIIFSTTAPAKRESSKLNLSFHPAHKSNTSLSCFSI